MARKIVLLCVLLVTTGSQNLFSFDWSFGGLFGKTEVPNRLKKYYEPETYKPTPLNEEERANIIALLRQGGTANTDLTKINFFYAETVECAAANSAGIFIGQTFHLFNEKQKVAILQHEFKHFLQKDDKIDNLGNFGISLARYSIGAIAGKLVYKIARNNNFKKLPSLFLSCISYITTKNMLTPLHDYEPWLNVTLHRHAVFRADQAMLNCPDSSYIKEFIPCLQNRPLAPNPDWLADKTYRPGLIRAFIQLFKALPQNGIVKSTLQFLEYPSHPDASRRAKRLELFMQKMETQELASKKE